MSLAASAQHIFLLFPENHFIRTVTRTTEIILLIWAYRAVPAIRLMIHLVSRNVRSNSVKLLTTRFRQFSMVGYIFYPKPNTK